MQPRILLPILLASLLACAAAAQRTWIVDYRGGPGVDFTDVPPAVAAATTGDTILVESGGNYFAPQIVGKGLTVAGRNGPFRVTGLTEIRALPVGLSVTISELVQWFGAGMQCRDCAGTIHLQSCQFGLQCASNLFGLHTYVDCARITMHRTVLYGTSAPIEFTRSNVYATDCLFAAGAHWCGFGGGATAISHAVRMEDSRLEMTRSILAGAGETQQLLGTAPVTMLRSTLIAGEGSWIWSGDCGPATPLAGSRDSTVVTDPAVWWNCPTHPSLSQNVTLSQRIVTSVWTLAARWGVHVDVTVRSEPYALTVLVADFPSASVPQATPYGNLWFDPSRALVLGAFAMPGGGFARMRVPLSTSLPPLTMLAFQAVALRSSGQFELSLPAIVSVLP